MAKTTKKKGGKGKSLTTPKTTRTSSPKAGSDLQKNVK